MVSDALHIPHPRCRLLLLDMVLGNQDRLAVEALSWRGNSQNMMFCHRGEFQNRTVAIDSLVQRRPPGKPLNSPCIRAVCKAHA